MLRALPAEARRLKALGARYLEFYAEICSIDEDYRSPALWAEVARVLGGEGLGATVHLPLAWVDLTSLDRHVWEGSVGSLEAALAALEPLGPAMAAVHPANYGTQAVVNAAPPQARPDLAAALGERLVSALVRLRRAPCGSVAAVENLEGMPLDLFRLVTKAAGVGVCLDAGHAVAEGYDPVELLGEMADRLVGLHLHDAVRAGAGGPAGLEALTISKAGLPATPPPPALTAIDSPERAHRPLGTGELDLDRLVRALLDVRFGGPVVLEIIGDAASSAKTFLEAVGRSGEAG